ncbi:MAG: S8 family serine peptidase [Cytophagaceae bacterium]|nr:S8 family serine peptidase [Cytophagaceae bacterium]MDW8455852.1 S8 family serine peptidase [Cytophagaceae bacterium]
MRNQVIVFVLCLMSITAEIFAQSKYWIEFTDKDTTEYNYAEYLSAQAIENRIRYNIPLYQYTDVAPKKKYIQQLKEMRVQPIVISRWLNSVSAVLTPEQKELISKLPYVKGIHRILPGIQICNTQVDVNSRSFHETMQQMEISEFLQAGLTGKGVSIGVIDAGFYDAHRNDYLKHLFDEHRIIKQRDFLDTTRTDIITQKATNSDSHGKTVLEHIAGYNTSLRIQKGMAPNATYYLARTEHGDREFRGEEDTWIAAMEWMDQLGVRLINTSLGYSIKMDDPNDNYKKEDMNGATTRISKAADIAFYEKGIFLVVSAGNEGANPDWGIISSPADARGALSVGATILDNCMKIDYSSIGPEYNDYLKPNVSCYSYNGTSFSAPAVTGFVACIMEKAPWLSNKEVKEIVEKSAHLYPYGNNYVGYGIPKAGRALQLLKNIEYTSPKTEMREVNTGLFRGKKYLLKIEPTTEKEAVLFHKKNERIVISQISVSISDNKILIKKPHGCTRTTIVYGDHVTELIW